MRGLLLLLLFAASLAWGAWNDYREQQPTLSGASTSKTSAST